MNTAPVNEALAGLEAQLAKFWAPPEEADGSSAAKVRAATTNFVAVSSQADVARLREASETLADTHAGRALLLALDGRIAPWEATTDVHAECRVDGSVPICYDRVEILFGAMAAGRAASVVRALALPEVPIVMEAAPGAPALLVDELAPICDRVIVDSAHMSLARVADVIRETRGAVADRAWVRSFSWRELVARFFDDDPQTLRSIKRVEIGRTGGGKVEPSALFIGWLASRLGWSFASKTEAKDREGRSVEIAVVEVQRVDLLPGVIASVRISTELGGAPLELALVRCETPGGRVARWTMEGAKTASHDHPLGFRDENWVLVKAIDSIEGDAIYRQSALAAADWSAR